MRASFHLAFASVSCAVTIRAIDIHPQKIICVGLNYADHAKETGASVGDEPVIFNKFPTTLRANGDPIELPTGVRYAVVMAIEMQSLLDTLPRT